MIYTNIEWAGAYIKCDICTHRWTAVYPSHLDILECPNCRHMVTFEIIQDANIQQT